MTTHKRIRVKNPEDGRRIFAGSDYVPALDNARLTGQIQRVFNVMQSGDWRTLAEISEVTGDPPASVSAQLRHLRKPKFGSYTISKRRRGDRSSGLFEYRMEGQT